MINSTREQIEFSYTNLLQVVVLLVFALATALIKFCFRLLKDKVINLVMVMKYHFDFRLQFDIIKNLFSRVSQKSYLIMVRAIT